MLSTILKFMVIGLIAIVVISLVFSILAFSGKDLFFEQCIYNCN